MCTVSVIIPTYKHRQYVLQTLDSVFAQSLGDYEVIVVNDGSPDDTEQVLRPLAEAGRIRYFRQPNRGQASARNRGLAKARGEFIAFLDDDDLWPADKLEWQVAVLREHPSAVLVYGACKPFGRQDAGSPSSDGPAGEALCDDIRERLLELNHIVSPGSTLIRASALRRIGGFDERIWGADDWDLYLRLALLGPFAYRDRPALLYRLHSENASQDFLRMYLNCCIVQRRHDRLQPRGKRPAFRPLNRRMRTHYCHECIRRAERSLRSGDFAAGFGCWWRAIRIDETIAFLNQDAIAALVDGLFPQSTAGFLRRVGRAVRWRARLLAGLERRGFARV